MKIPATFQVLLRRQDDGGGLHFRTTETVRLADDKSVPEWIQICTTGSFKKGDRKFAITPAMLTEMVENFSTGKHPVPPTELVVDYEHLSAADTDNPEAGKAAGWIKALELRDDGATLWARVEWTPPAIAKLQAKEFKYISPEFHFNFTTPANETIGCTLLAIAITNRPFLQGMEPITLTARSAADTIALAADLSYEQRRMLIERALRKRGTCSYCYVVATKDTSVVYEASSPTGAGYAYYEESYTIADDGTVSLGGDAVEVVVSYEPLGAEALRASRGEGHMKVIALKDSTGKDVQIPESAIEALPIVKELRTQLTERVPKTDHDKLQADVVALTGKVDALTTQNEQQAKAIAQRDADDAVEKLIAGGKATAGQRDSLTKLFLSNRELFNEVTAGLAPVVQTGELGHGKKAGEQLSAVQEVHAEVERLRAADAKLTVEAATQQVFEKNATLYARYVKETEQKVGKTS